MKSSDFTGTGTLFKLFLRRDRFLLPIWVCLPMVLVLFTGGTFTALANAGMESALSDFDNDPLVSALLGPVMSFDLPGAITWRGVSQIALTLGLGSLLTMIRHTRTDEETGRSELIRAYVIGSYANLTAALLLTGVGNLVAGVLMVVTIIGLGGAVGGSLVFGATMVMGGCFFAGMGALGAQFRESSSSARNIAIAALGLALLLMFLNNFSGGYTLLSWITPFAWQRITQPFAGDHGWNVLYCAVFALVPTIIAYVLSTRRDLGGGVLMAHAGPQEAAPHFSNPLALAWRLQKGGFVGWLAAVVLYIGVFSVISPSLSSAGVSDWLSSLGGTNWANELGLGYVFIGVSIYLMALAVAVYAMSALLRLKKEENEGRAELLLDKPVSRIQWVSSHVIVVAFCSAALLLAMGAVGGLGYGFAVGNLGGEFWIILGMSVSKIPAVWSLLGITALLYGLLPRLTFLGWIVWMAVVFLEVAWEGQLIDWSIMQFSPFSYVHYTVHVTAIQILPLVGLLGVSAILIGMGLFGFRNRDVVTKA